MPDTPIDSTQRFYARLAGVMYLLNYAASIFGTMTPLSIAGSGEFAERARRMLAAEHFVRASLASMAIGWVMIVVLAFSLYVALEPVNKRLAQLALLLEVAQAAVGAATVMFSFATLRLYIGFSPTGPISGEQAEAIRQVVGGGAGSGFNVAMLFLAAGSTLFFYLFFKSRYIPRLLAGWGVFASVVMLLVSVGMLIFPEHAGTLQFGWGPMGLAEVSTALWLTIRGIRAPQSTAG